MDNRPIFDAAAPMPGPGRTVREPTLDELIAVARAGTRSRPKPKPWRNPHAARVDGTVKAQRRSKGKAAKNARRRNR